MIQRKLRKSKEYSEKTPKERSSLSVRNTMLVKEVEVEVDEEEDDGMAIVEGEAGDKATVIGGEEVTMASAIASFHRFGHIHFDMP